MSTIPRNCRVLIGGGHELVQAKEESERGMLVLGTLIDILAV